MAQLLQKVPGALRSSAGWVAVAAAASIFSSCAAPHPLEREVNYSEAMAVEILDKGFLVDGEPVSAQGLPAAIEAAHGKRGGGDRRAAIVYLRLVQGAAENANAFSERLIRRREEALDDLLRARVRDIHWGALPKSGPDGAAGAR